MSFINAVMAPRKAPNPSPGEEARDPIDPAVHRLLIPDEEVRYRVATDLDPDGRFGETWLIATNFRVITARPPEAAEELPPNLCRLEMIKDVPLWLIQDAVVKDFVGNGVLMLTVDPLAGGEPKLVEMARFSRSTADRMETLSEVIRELARRARECIPEESGEDPIDRARNKPSRRCDQCDRPFVTGVDFCTHCLDRGTVLRRMLQYLRPYPVLVSAALAMTVFSVLLNLTPPYLTKLLVDDVFTRHETKMLWIVSAAYAARYILGAVLQAVRMKTVAWLSQSVIFDIRTQLYQHLQQLSLGYFDRRHVGAVMSRVMNDTAAVNQFLVDAVQNFLINVVTLVLIGIIMFAFDWKLALLALIPTPLMILMTRWFTHRVKPIYRRYYANIASMNANLATAIGGVRVVKSFAQEDREIDRFTASAREFFKTNIESNDVNVIYSPSLTLLSGIGALAVWIVGGLEVLHGQISGGSVIMFTAYMWQFFAPVQALCDLNNQITNAATAAERIFQLLDTQPEVKDVPNADSPAVAGRVDFNHVSFTYDANEGGEPVLKDIHFGVEPGELVGLVGHSGSGKTSLVNLLLRFYDPTEGQILIDGQDLRELDSRALRSQVGMVLQEPYLFTGTIAENIAYGRPDATSDQIIEAAKMANAHAFINRFPEAYDSEVGERGIKLSGGEKQRISIARAILNNPRILILDEATSAVDTETEALIQEAMERLMQNRTSFAIAHRLSTLKNASKLVVLDKGQVAEMGTHEQLLAREDGIYSKLVRIQTEMARTPG